MRPFAYQRAKDASAAVAALAAAATDNNPLTESAVQPLAGGTTLLDLMKLGVMQPAAIVDINSLPVESLGEIDIGPNGLRLGSMVRMAEAADDPDLVYPGQVFELPPVPGLSGPNAEAGPGR